MTATRNTVTVGDFKATLEHLRRLIADLQYTRAVNLIDAKLVELRGAVEPEPKCKHTRVRVFDTCPAAYSCWDCGEPLDPPESR